MPSFPSLPAFRAAALLALGLSAAPLQAATWWIVNSTADAPDRDTANGICDAEVGGQVVCTLRAAVMQAAAGDVVQLAAGATYTLTRPRFAAEPDAWGGDLDIQVATLTIQGPVLGARPTIRADDGFNDRLIRVEGWNKLILRRAVLDGADNENGGAIAGSLMDLSDVRIQDSGADSGGAIWANAAVSLTRCEFVGNHARVGGAIWFDSSSNGPLMADTVSFIDNRADERGGAFYIAGNSTANLTNATFHGNRAPDGAALASQVVFPSWVTLNNATITGNGGLGGATQSAIVLGGVIYPANSVIAGNDAAADIRLDGGSNVLSSGHNVLGTIDYDPANNIVTLDATDRPAPAYLGLLPPSIAPWSTVGITTLVPAADSPLRDTGHPGSGGNTECAPVDANGVARGAMQPCDVGAAEYLPSADVLFADGFDVPSAR
jgi:CSLREA domain-containing protein